MADFIVPKTNTKVIGVPGFDYAFQLRAQLDAPVTTRTGRGGRFFQQILAGQVSGPRLTGTVFPASGMHLHFVERDGVQELNTRLMIKADTTEWLYLEQRGYRRADGYHRIQAQIDADRQGKYALLNGAMFVGVATEAAGGREITYTYFELV